MSISIRFFATLKDRTGTDKITLDDNSLASIATIDDLRQYLVERYPSLAPALPSAIAAVNREYVFSGHPLNDNDEVAFFPPVSGGSNDIQWPELFLLPDQPIDLNAITAQIVQPQTGALAVFSGYVRGETHHKDRVLQTTYLEYEAYEEMALAKMKQVTAEIRKQWPLIQGIAIIQRIGHLSVGDPTVTIACASAHRDQGCFEAARYGIDRLKEIVPVWKKEVGADGSSWVEGHYHPTPEDIN